MMKIFKNVVMNKFKITIDRAFSLSTLELAFECQRRSERLKCRNMYTYGVSGTK